MIVCYHTEIIKPWTSDELQQRLQFIPDSIKKQILCKRIHLDVQLSVTGNLLILALLNHFQIDLTLTEIVYNDYRRPYFDDRFDFNISHSGNRIVACATLSGKVGIDIELIKPVSLDYNDYFTINEQQNIRYAEDPDTAFFKYWTRKEAVLKAVGTGVYTPLLDIDVSAEESSYQDKTYYLSPINIATSYQACIAHTVMQEISLNDITV
jgi:4'-phosphopantetheinyl transferase